MVKHILLVILLILEIFCFYYEIKTQLIDSGKPSRLHSYTEIQDITVIISIALNNGHLGTNVQLAM